MRLSKKAKKEIKKRKKWYEKSVVSRHIGRVGKDDYLYILYYNLWGGDPKGALAIGANGELPNPADTKEAVFMVSTFNNVMEFAARDKWGMRDIVRRPIGLMNRLETQLIQYFGEILPDSHELYKELSLLRELATVMQENQPLFKNMFEDIWSIFKEQEQDHVLTNERFNRVYKIFLDWHVLIYKEQRMQLLMHEGLPVIMEYVKPDLKAGKLYKMLKNFYTEKRRKAFENFLEGVVDKEFGDIENLLYSSEDLHQFRILKEREGIEGFRSRLAPLIRNE
ncbi:hypothetical protein [Rossellomorea marisflavi]|uniref:hypothetical protein n=1 Tax=Rossellomorea marisflavi TaxID=189381 RepID=UPI0035163470